MSQVKMSDEAMNQNQIALVASRKQKGKMLSWSDGKLSLHSSRGSPSHHALSTGESSSEVEVDVDGGRNKERR